MINPAHAEQFFAASGHTFAEILALADQGQPLPHFPLKGRLRATEHMKLSEVESQNVIGLLPGSDPALKNEYVVFGAHLDHLGVGAPINGDRIYNGAMDDGSGIASLIEIADIAKQENLRPQRSILFVAVTGEEKGLLGSQYFTSAPTVPLKNIVADINMDMYLPLFPLKSLQVMGLEESTLGADIRAVAAKAGVAVQPDPEPQRNLFIRSDQYNFIRNGVPALTFKFGYDERFARGKAGQGLAAGALSCAVGRSESAGQISRRRRNIIASCWIWGCAWPTRIRARIGTPTVSSSASKETNGAACAIASMRHGVDHVIDGDLYGQRTFFLRIVRRVGKLPGVAEIGVVRDGDDDPALVVLDRPPMRAAAAVRAVLAALAKMGFAGNLRLVADVEHGVEVRVVVGELDDVPVWEGVTNALGEHRPLGVAVKIVGHEEAAALDVFAELGAFLLGQTPFAYLDRIDPGEIKSIVVIVERDHLFHRTHIDTRETAHGPRQVPVGARIILGPERKAAAVVALKTRIVAVSLGSAARKHEAREGPFGGDLVIRRERKVVVFDGGVFAPRLLESIRDAEKHQGAADRTQDSSQTHAA